MSAHVVPLRVHPADFGTLSDIGRHTYLIDEDLYKHLERPCARELRVSRQNSDDLLSRTFSLTSF